MENGGEAAAAAATVAPVAVREEEPPTYADASAAGDAEMMATPRSEIADLGTPDATTPVVRGGGAAAFGRDYYGGDEADVFEEAVQDSTAAAAGSAPRGDDVPVDDDASGDGEVHDPPPVSTGADGDGAAQGGRPYWQIGGGRASEDDLSGSAVDDYAVEPNSGEVIGGYDEGPGPEKSAQQADDISVAAGNGGNGAVAGEEPEAVDGTDMQIDGRDRVQQNGSHEHDNADQPLQHDNGLTNGDREASLPPEPAVVLVSEELVPPTEQDKVVLPVQDTPSVEPETGGGDTQTTTAADEYLEAASIVDVTEMGSDKVHDTVDEPAEQGGTATARSLDNGDAYSGAAADRNVSHDSWSDFDQSQEGDRKQDEAPTTKPATADVLSQLSGSPPPKSDTHTVESSNEDKEDEAESSPLQTPLTPPPTMPKPDQKSSATSQSSHPSGLGTSAPLPEPATRAAQQQQQPLQPPRVNGSVSHRQPQPSEDGAAANGEAVEEYDETREKLQMIRVKFLRLAHRLGQTPHNVVVAQVLYRLGLAEQLRGSMNTGRAGAFSFDRASAMAEQLEAAGQEPLDFSCTIMVIGKTGVGKTATINSIFDEVRLRTDAFQLGTKNVQEIVGTVQGIKVRVIDTPGLLPSLRDQLRNEKNLQNVKKFIKKNPPDVIMYLDRLDMQSRDLGDVPLLRTITNVFGPSIWFNAIVVLTHAASAPPEGANGSPLSYEMYVTQRTHVIQNAIRQAAGDPRLLNPVSLVENHSACRMNRAGQRVLPNGQVWKPHLLLLSFASKILTEANMLLKLQDVPAGRPFGVRQRSPPLPYFLSSLLQSRPQVKLPDEQFGEDDPTDMDLDEESESDEEADYDELPPFKKLTNEQVSGLSKAQRKAYFEELDYREKLFYKKQLKEERRRRKLLKQMAAEAKNIPDEYNNEAATEEENSAPATVPVPMNDMALPASFDSDYPSHRYRFLDSASQWIVRPVLETQGWDHDIGYEGVNAERLFVVRDKIPLSVSGQLTKDKKECTLQMEMASSVKHGEGKATSLGLDVQSIGKDMAYTLRGETRFCNFRRNSTAAGISATLLGDTLSAGLKIEDKLTLGKRFKMLVSGGAMSGRGDVAYGGRLEATLKDKDYPLGRKLSTLALSVVDWHGELAVGCNLQSQIPVGRSTNMTAHASLNNRGTGQVGVRVNSSEQLLLAMAALAPILSNARKYIFGSSESI